MGRSLIKRFEQLENRLHHALVLHSITFLRIAVGAVFLGFGILKFFPHISPAENLTETATHLLTLKLVGGSTAIVFVAALECFIGVCLLTKRGMRIAVWLLVAELVGVLSPLALVPSRLFSGPHNAPTLEGQYVLKDVVLVAAGMVIAAATFRGGRLTRDDPAPGTSAVNGPPEATYGGRTDWTGWSAGT